MGAKDDEADENQAGRRHLQVAYPSVQTFLADYRENISRGGTFISSQRAWSVGDRLNLTLTFPGLLDGIEITGRVTWATIGHESGVGVQFAFDEHPELKQRLALLVQAIEAGDPRVVARLVRVLVVEDNALIAEMLKEGLSRQAGRCTPVPAVFLFHSADNGADALTVIETTPIDVLIVDMFLPVLGGGALIMTCREIFGVQLPILAISGGGPEAREDATRAGADLFLAKPLRLQRVFEAMAQLLAIDLND